MTKAEREKPFEQLVRESIPLISFHFRSDLSPDIDPQTSRLLILVAAKAASMLAALAQTNSVIEGMEKTMLMVQS